MSCACTRSAGSRTRTLLPERNETRFGISASGVDKSKLEIVGRDVLMVKDFDDERG